ncbi:DNA recombination protein RmuC [Pseudactinotalea sp. Z1739]|uniref:DNA recombination protein RmuC n=1 Tax=Pseudactinotalea sp. Z1739 TaxID=3413028 RepID=UPI003C7B9DE7
MEFTHVLLIVGALLLGIAGGFLVARQRAAAQSGQLNARAVAAERELAAVRQMHDQQVRAERDSAVERLQTERSDAAARLEEERNTAAQRLVAREQELAQRLADRERELAEQLRAEREAAAQRVEEMRADTKRLADEFEALSRKALAANSESFLQQAAERLKRAEESSVSELAKREEAIKSLVEPLQRTLGEVKAEMTSAEKARLAAHTALDQQVQAMRESSDSLRTETGQLVTALRAPQIRGRWGELQLRRVVEAAGMVEHVDFTEQDQLDGGALRPDLVVKLPGDKQIVVDSKVSFNGYLEAMEAREESVRAERLKAHARHLRKHIDDLDSKAYWEHISGSPEFTVMFVPAEAFLNAALEQDPTLLEHAFGKNVVIATPPTLVALLRTVGYTWRQELLAAEAQQVFTVGRELHKRLATFGEHLQKVSRSLNSTVDAFNKMNASLDSRLVPQVRRFSGLQGLEDSFEVPPPLEVLAVAAHKEDLYASAADEEAQQRHLDGADETTKLVESADAVAKKVVHENPQEQHAGGDTETAIA